MAVYLLACLDGMESFSHFVLYQLPYFAIPFYCFMMGMRIWVWLRFYNPALKLLPNARGSVFKIWQRQYRPTIHLFPGRPRTKGLEWGRSIKGFLFFTGLWKRDKVLWLGSWLLHFGLALFALVHVRLFFSVGENTEHYFQQVALVSCYLMAGSGVYLLLRRVVVKRVREITDFRDYFSELALLVFSLTALLVMLDGGIDGDDAVAYAVGLITFSPVAFEVSTWWMWHMLSVQVLLIIMPFSHLLHLGGIFLSRQFLGTSDSFAGEFGEIKNAKLKMQK